MTEEKVEELLSRAGLVTRPDPARLKALITPLSQPVPSPLSAYVKVAVGALALVAVVTGSTWLTTATVPIAADEVESFAAYLDEDTAVTEDALALLDADVSASLESTDAFTPAFLDATL